MELQDGDLLLREWTEADVPALVAGCNDAEISYWIPLIPHPYTEEDAREFVSGDVAPADYRLAITVAAAVVGGIGMGLNSDEYRATIGYWVARGRTGSRDLHDGRYASSRATASTSSSCSGST